MHARSPGQCQAPWRAANAELRSDRHALLLMHAQRCSARRTCRSSGTQAQRCTETIAMQKCVERPTPCCRTSVVYNEISGLQGRNGVSTKVAAASGPSAMGRFLGKRTTCSLGLCQPAGRPAAAFCVADGGQDRPVAQLRRAAVGGRHQVVRHSQPGRRSAGCHRAPGVIHGACKERLRTVLSGWCMHGCACT